MVAHLRRFARLLARHLMVAALWTNLLLPLLMVGRELWTTHRVAGADLFQPAALGSDAARSAAAAYRAQRRPVLDSLLPMGHGGVQVTDAGVMDGRAGIAILDLGAIALSAEHLTTRLHTGGGLTGEMVEIHERAHLLQARHPRKVAALMRTLPPPHEATYAATSAVEHFAEMAAEAYRVVVFDPDAIEICLEDTPLRLAERDVPGTAGFVVWFLRHLDPAAVAAPGYDALLEEATALRGDPSPWEPIYAALDAQRLDDGTLAPWPPPTRAAAIRDLHQHLLHDGELVNRIVGWVITPAGLLASALESLP